ncbi:transporter substrate-binding domain-containing protein [Thalassotalea sp. LPB0316]|uniref:ATP-binding protein n=1 Tax=Thalassotalea sp. LPB0316 TaxID=2769490 RepID=UPI0018680FD8|nr:transporter substrate-binding domain-containing protein [Thalassotalea sp. LPB0316]QOL26185.1 transporter substrate-binding domain-containing protein [Thalassotalea sp. LPB0316]
MIKALIARLLTRTNLLFVGMLLLVQMSFSVAGQAVDHQPLRIALPDKASLALHSAGNFEQVVNLMQEYWQDWSIDNQREIEFIRLPSSHAIEALQDNLVDVVAITATREHSNTLVSIPYAKYHQRIFRRLDADNTSQIVMAIHAPNNLIQASMTPAVQRTFYHSLDDVLDNYQNYNVIYSVQPWELEKQLAERGLNDIFYVSENDTPDIYFRMAFRSSDEALALKVNDDLRQISKLQAQLWTDKYIIKGENRFALTLGEYELTLSANDKRYVLHHPHLRFPSLPEGFPPYFITDSFNHIGATGFSVDLLNTLTNKLGVTFEPVYLASLALAEQAVLSRELDFYHLHVNDQERYPYLKFSNTLINTNLSLITRNNDVLSNHISSLTNEIIGVVDGFVSTEALINRLPNATFKYYQSLKELFGALASGDVNAIIEPSLSASYCIKQNGYAHFTVQPLHGFLDNIPMSFATVPANADLIVLLNRALNAIDSERYEALYAKWNTAAFSEGDIYQQVAVIYQKAGYILLTIFFMSVLMTIFYLRQLRLRKAAQHEAEQALVVAEKARAAAEQSGIAKTSFLARMSHEIRTPMNGVFGMAEALRYTELDKHQRDLLTTLTHSADNLLVILNDVLDFSKMDAGKLTLESVPVNLTELANNVISAFTPVAEQKNLQLTLKIDSELASQYMLDPTRLTQVLNNLVSNALKFTESGSVEVNIDLDKREHIDGSQYDSVSFAVIDSGIGIAPEQQNLLFSPFLQADSAITRRFGGTGLGLSICQEIINAMGSKIATKSVEGEGSTFYFTIAMKAVPVEKAACQVKQVNIQALSDFSTMKVLLVEDNIVNVKVLTAQLERLAIRPDLAYNGEEGLALHKQHQYDLIISDCHMPVMDGFELAKTITGMAKTKPFWLVAVTADALADTAKKCLDAGFNDYMTKPCPQDQITEKMQRAYDELQRQKYALAASASHGVNIAEGETQDATHGKLFCGQRLMRRNNNDKVLTTRVCQLFLDTWQEEIAQLECALAQDNFDQISAIAHKFKGSLRYLAVSEIEQPLTRIEKYANSQDSQQLSLAVTEFIALVKVSANEIAQWLNNQS